MRPHTSGRSLPSVTCVMTAYNYEGYVAEALRSVLEQDYPAELLDVVVVDDGSTDATAEAVGAVAAGSGGRIALVRRVNGGLGAATTTAIGHARGDLVAILDADDRWLPGKVSAQVEALLEHPGATLVYGDMHVVDAAGALLDDSFFRRHRLAPLGGRVLDDLLRVNFTANSTLLFRRGLARQVPIPAWSPYADYWIVLTAAAAGELVPLEQPLAEYRLHDANMTFGVAGDRMAEELRREVRFLRGALVDPVSDAASPRGLVGGARELAARLARLDADGLATVESAPDERERAEELLSAPAWGPARVRNVVRAFALDPLGLRPRTALDELDRSASRRPPELRGSVVAAHADELAGDPRRLESFTSAYGPDDDVTLLVAARGDLEEEEQRLVSALVGIGADPAACGDILVVPEREWPAAVETTPLGAPARARRRRVLLMGDRFYPSIGGTELLIEELGVLLLERGFDVDVAAVPEVNRVHRHHRGLAIHEIVGDERKAVARLVDRRAYEAVLASGYPTGWPMQSLLALEDGSVRRYGVPCVNEDAYRLAVERPGFLPAYAAAVRRLDRLVVASYDGWDVRLASELGLEADMIPNAVHDSRAQQRPPTDPPTLLMVANMWPEKNHLGLLQTLRGAPGDWRLLLVGRPSQNTPELAGLVAAAAALDPRVELIPGLSRPEVAVEMASADLLLLPSIAEATPFVLLEAMVQRLPWLTTPTCASARDLAGGVIAPLETFPRVISALLADVEARRALGDAGRAHWHACYSWNVVGEQYVSLLAGRPIPVPAPPPEAVAVTASIRRALTTLAAAA